MEWHKIQRASGLIEWVCPHGVGHPDHESARWLATELEHTIDTWLTHGCDGCCSRKDFPGAAKGKDSERCLSQKGRSQKMRGVAPPRKSPTKKEKAAFWNRLARR